MPNIDGILSAIESLTPLQVVLALAAVTALMLVMGERRLSLVPLLVQYFLVGLLLGPQVYRPIVVIRMGLGVAICLILYLTARNVQKELHTLPNRPSDESSLWQTPLAPMLRALGPMGMGPTFRLIVMILGSLVAYGVWRSLNLDIVPSEITLTSCWLMTMGLLMALTSVDPLRMGFGLLTFVNGFEAMYLFLEQGLTVVGILGVVDIAIALGIVTCAEAWLESLKGEAAP